MTPKDRHARHHEFIAREIKISTETEQYRAYVKKQLEIEKYNKERGRRVYEQVLTYLSVSMAGVFLAWVAKKFGVELF